jgi:hypothetical protein
MQPSRRTGHIFRRKYQGDQLYNFCISLHGFQRPRFVYIFSMGSSSRQIACILRRYECLAQVQGADCTRQRRVQAVAQVWREHKEVSNSLHCFCMLNHSPCCRNQSHARWVR